MTAAGSRQESGAGVTGALVGTGNGGGVTGWVGHGKGVVDVPPIGAWVPLSCGSVGIESGIGLGAGVSSIDR